jgi:hypothetical protein
VKVRPGDLNADATQADRIARLERYVEALDRDVYDVHRAIEKKAEDVTAAAIEREQQLHAEIERRDEDRRQKLRPSLRRQAFGGVCVGLGLVLGTWGGLCDGG